MKSFEPRGASVRQTILPNMSQAVMWTALAAGVLAQMTWEIWARGITPLLPGVDGPLEPAGLIQAVFGLDNRLVAELIHLFVGVVAYPLGYLFIAQPLQRLIIPSLPWWGAATGYGLGLFVFAFYVMMHLVAGFPAFMDWEPIAFASLAGHILLGLAIGLVVKLRG